IRYRETETARHESSRITLDREDVLLSFRLRLFCILVSTTESIFLICKQHKPDGSLRLIPNSFECPKHFHCLHAACTIIMCTFAIIPTIEVTADGDDLVRKLTAD